MQGSSLPARRGPYLGRSSSKRSTVSGRYQRGSLRVLAYKQNNPREELEKATHGDRPISWTPQNLPASEAKHSGVAATAWASSKKKATALESQLFGKTEVRPSYGSFAFEAPLFYPVFSRRREVWAGRLAMLGFLMTSVQEVFSAGHPGALAQVHNLSNLPMFVVDLALLGFVVHGLTGLLPSSLTWSQENFRDFMRRPEGPNRKAINPLQSPGDFFGAGVWGFTKRNEVFSGRVAMLGFLAACVGEVYSGYGPVGQIGWWLHLPVNDVYYGLAAIALVGYSVFAGWFAYHLKRPFETSGDDDIYN